MNPWGVLTEWHCTIFLFPVFMIFTIIYYRFFLFFFRQLRGRVVEKSIAWALILKAIWRKGSRRINFIPSENKITLHSWYESITIFPILNIYGFKVCQILPSSRRRPLTRGHKNIPRLSARGHITHLIGYSASRLLAVPHISPCATYPYARIHPPPSTLKPAFNHIVPIPTRSLSLAIIDAPSIWRLPLGE